MRRDPANILIVDDRHENLVALSAALEPLGQRVIQASSGEAALKQLLVNDFAVVLLDVQMPGMDGFETARLIRRRKRTRFLPIIFLTAISSDTDQIFRGYEEGAVDYILKPLDPHILRAKVGVFVELHQLQVETKLQAEKLQARRLAEMAEQNEELLQTLTAQLPEFVWRLDAQGTVKFLSRSAADYVGVAMTDVLRTGLWPHIHEDDVDAARAQWADAMKCNAAFEIELRVRRHDGQFRWHVMRGHPQPATDGRPFTWVGTTIDIDDRKAEEIERERRHVIEQQARAVADERARRARLLADLSEGFDPKRDVVTSLNRLLAMCVPAFADFGSVEGLRRDGRIEVLATAHADPRLTGVLRKTREHHGLPSDSEFGVATLLRTGRPFFRRDLGSMRRDSKYHVNDELVALWDQLDPISCICVPLFSREGVLGFLMLCTSTASGRQLDDEMFELFKECGRRTSLMLENTQLYDDQRRIARTLQMNLLSGTNARVEGLTTAAYYQAAAQEMEIGGDWYDVIALPGEQLAVAVGDIVGRGLGAAAVMAQLRSAIRALAFVCPSPAELLTRLDSYAEITSGASYSTVAYGVLDPRTGAFRFACAGHPPPLLVPPDGPSCYLEGGRSTPLGMPHKPRTEATIDVSPGSIVVLFSDGLVDRRGEGLDDGLERLRRTAESTSWGTLLEFADGLVGAILEHGEVEDDVALLCVRVEPIDASVFSRRFSARTDQLARHRTELRNWLHEQGISDEAGHDVLLACGEACVNAIDHAYRDQVGGEVAIEVRRIGDQLQITVRDFGHWRRPAVPGLRGRGLTVMHACMDRIELTTLTTGTMVRMVKALQPVPV